MSSKETSLIFDITTSFAAKIIVLIGSFLTSVIIARTLGPEGQGIVTAVFVLPNIIRYIADLGIRQSAAYYTGQKIYNTDTIHSAILTLWVFSSFIALTIVGGYYYFFMKDDYGWLILFLALLTIPLKLFFNYYKGIVHGKNHILAINISEILHIIIYFFGALILVAIFELGTNGAALIQILISLILSLYFIYIVNQFITWKYTINIEAIKNILMKGFPFALALFLLTLNYKIDIVILRFYVDNDQIGLYSVGTNIAELVWQLPASIGLVIFAQSANSKSGTSAARKAVKILRSSYPIVIVICIFIMLIAPFIITIMYGQAYYNSSTVLRLLMPGIIALCISKVLHPDLAGRGHPLYALKAFILPLIINIILNFVLIPIYGINGAAIASTISYIIGGITYLILYSRKEKIPVKSILIMNKEDFNAIKNIINRSLKKFTRGRY